MINRHYTNKKILDLLEPNKVLIIYGPRQAGKTTLMRGFIETFKGNVYRGTGENAPLQEVLASNDIARITFYFRGYDLIFIDEAQQIENIGVALKIIVDHIPGVRVVVTGSSSFDLSNKIGEPLVGRQNIITLYPISIKELSAQYGGAYPVEHHEHLLLYGMYPAVLTADSYDKKRDILAMLRDGYLYRDILALERVRNSKKILDLLRLLAYQIGKEVSLQEIARQLAMSRATVERYLDLLEKAFVVINVRGFSKNLRSEVTKTSRYYFFDIGIRNAVIDNFSPLSHRSGDEIGMLWENYIVVERLKKRSYDKIYANQYFWRTWEQQEIDLVEERDGKLYGYEIKYTKERTVAPALWISAYPDASYEVIARDNYLPFVL